MKALTHLRALRYLHEQCNASRRLKKVLFRPYGDACNRISIDYAFSALLQRINTFRAIQRTNACIAVPRVSPACHCAGWRMRRGDGQKNDFQWRQCIIVLSLDGCSCGYWIPIENKRDTCTIDHQVCRLRDSASRDDGQSSRNDSIPRLTLIQTIRCARKQFGNNNICGQWCV